MLRNRKQSLDVAAEAAGGKESRRVTSIHFATSNQTYNRQQQEEAVHTSARSPNEKERGRGHVLHTCHIFADIKKIN